MFVCVCFDLAVMLTTLYNIVCVCNRYAFVVWMLRVCVFVEDGTEETLKRRRTFCEVAEAWLKKLWRVWFVLWPSSY